MKWFAACYFHRWTSSSATWCRDLNTPFVDTSGVWPVGRPDSWFGSACIGLNCMSRQVYSPRLGSFKYFKQGKRTNGESENESEREKSAEKKRKMNREIHASIQRNVKCEWNLNMKRGWIATLLHRWCRRRRRRRRQCWYVSASIICTPI